MKESVVLYVLLLACWMSLSAYRYTCGIKNTCVSALFDYSEEMFAPATPDGLSVKGTPVTAGENIRFLHSYHQPLVSAQLKQTFLRLQYYLLDHQENTLEITGAYSADEQNYSLLHNLGMARAEAAKAWLVIQGISARQIVSRQVLRDSLTRSGDTLMNALTFRVIKDYEPETVPADSLKAVEGRLRHSLRPFYFQDDAGMVVTPEVRQLVQDVKRYLQANPDKMLTLTGHTDESGDGETNVRMGRRLAEEVKRMLHQAGISNQQIRTNSKGSAVPSSDSRPADGINRNRRVEIKIN